jgi:hypothetical protein
VETGKKVAADYGRTLLASLITAFLLLGKPLFDLTGSDWKAVASAAVASWLPVVLVALNPHDTRYGTGSSGKTGLA